MMYFNEAKAIEIAEANNADAEVNEEYRIEARGNYFIIAYYEDDDLVGTF